MEHGKPVHFGRNKLIFNANDIMYQSTHVFTTNELLNINPDDVSKWMSLMALYHKENPSKEDRPTMYVCHQEFSLAHKEALTIF
jgi:hypothetical protein